MRTAILVGIGVFLMACGGGGAADDDDDVPPGDAAADAADPDGPPPVDAGPDGPPADAAPVGSVTVRAFSNNSNSLGMPDVGATVYFTRADGSLMGQDTVGQSGVVVGDVEDGGAVTVRATSPSPDWRTVAGVRIGDDLRFGSEDTVIGPLAVQMPPVSAELLWLFAPCVTGLAAGTATTVNGFTHVGCASPRDLVARASTTGQPDRFLVAPDTDILAGTTITMAGPWIDGVPRNATVIGFPANTSVALGEVKMAWNARVGGLFPGTLTGTGPSRNLAWSWAPGADDGMRVDVSYVAGGTRYQNEVTRDPAPAGAFTVDVTPRVPRVTGVQMNGNHLTWTLDGTGAFDSVLIDLGDGSANWRLTAPPGNGVRLPQLSGAPTTLEIMWLTDVDVTTSYDHVRPRAGLTRAVSPELPTTSFPASVSLQRSVYQP